MRGIPKAYCIGEFRVRSPRRRRPIEEEEILHRVMFTVLRPKLSAIQHRGGGDQGIRDLDAMAPSILLHKLAGAMSRFFIGRGTRERAKEIIQRLVFIRPAASPEFSYGDP